MGLLPRKERTHGLMRAGESLPHRVTGGHEYKGIYLLKQLPQGAWIHAFMPFPGVSGTGHGGTQGRLVAGQTPPPQPSWTAGKGKWASAMRTLLPPLMRWGAHGAVGSSPGAVHSGILPCGPLGPWVWTRGWPGAAWKRVSPKALSLPPPSQICFAVCCPCQLPGQT